MSIEHHFVGDKKPAGAYSPAVSVGDLVLTSGQVGTDPATGAAAEGIEAQTRATMDNLGRALEAAGATFADVVRTTVYLTDATELGAMDAVYRTYFGDAFPTRSTVTIAALARPEFRIEIDAIAVRPTAAN